ncbi:hypothetical protein AOLI_G00142410 [Acnodon oligacanthus]
MRRPSHCSGKINRQHSQQHNSQYPTLKCEMRRVREQSGGLSPNNIRYHFRVYIMCDRLTKLRHHAESGLCCDEQWAVLWGDAAGRFSEIPSSESCGQQGQTGDVWDEHRLQFCLHHPDVCNGSEPCVPLSSKVIGSPEL